MATNPNIQVDRQSLQRLNMNMNQFNKELNKVCKEALKNLGQRIVSQAQRTLWSKHKSVTGTLQTSGATKEAADGTILAGFSSIYAYYVEFGRKAGKYPPFRFIYEWVRQRHLTPAPKKASTYIPFRFRPKRVKKVRQKHLTSGTKEEKSIAYLIQRKIGEVGTKPTPFLKPAFEKNKRLYESILKKGAEKIMNKDYTR
jgi:hypothetical protein